MRERVAARAAGRGVPLPATATPATPTPRRARYADLLRAHPLDLCCLGIGENGHLAFNDPPVADFDDPLDVKVVALEAASRRQQVGGGPLRDDRRRADARDHGDDPRAPPRAARARDRARGAQGRSPCRPRSRARSRPRALRRSSARSRTRRCTSMPSRRRSLATVSSTERRSVASDDARYAQVLRVPERGRAAPPAAAAARRHRHHGRSAISLSVRAAPRARAVGRVPPRSGRRRRPLARDRRRPGRPRRARSRGSRCASTSGSGRSSTRSRSAWSPTSALVLDPEPHLVAVRIPLLVGRADRVRARRRPLHRRRAGARPPRRAHDRDRGPRVPAVGGAHRARVQRAGRGCPARRATSASAPSLIAFSLGPLTHAGLRRFHLPVPTTRPR